MYNTKLVFFPKLLSLVAFLRWLLKAGDGSRIFLVQHREDFIDNSKINVESLELQWIDGTRDNEGMVRLVDQQVSESSMELTFQLVDTLSDCVDTLEITEH